MKGLGIVQVPSRAKEEAKGGIHASGVCWYGEVGKVGIRYGGTRKDERTA